MKKAITSVDDDIKIVVGAGEFRNNPGWIYTQEKELNLLNRFQWEESFSPNSITAILAEHVWEHLTFEEGVVAAKNCFEFLRPGGYVRCAVPDGYFSNEEYQNIVKVGGPGPSDHPAASHKILFTYPVLTEVFENAGFQVHILEYCDEFGRFHFDEWDVKQGYIYRSKRFDHRNKKGKLNFVSLIIDAKKLDNH